MNDSTMDAGPLDGAGFEVAAPADDYRLREVEARLDRRLKAVEAQRERTRWALLLTAACFVLTVAALAVALWTVLPTDRSWTVDSLSAREIMLQDAEGIARGQFGTDTEGRTQLALSDQDGRERIRLTVLADGSPGVTISDPDARPRAILAYLPDGTTNLVFADAQGTSRAVFGVEPDGSTQALFSDRTGMVRTLVGVGADGEPSVTTFEDGEAPVEGDEAAVGGTDLP